jgi:hypothetical protein
MVRLNTYGVKYYQTLPIQWARPCDGQMLEQAIMIEVTEAHYGSATGGGGGSAGGGAGRDQHN